MMENSGAPLINGRMVHLDDPVQLESVVSSCYTWITGCRWMMRTLLFHVGTFVKLYGNSADGQWTLLCRTLGGGYGAIKAYKSK